MNNNSKNERMASAILFLFKGEPWQKDKESLHRKKSIKINSNRCAESNVPKKKSPRCSVFLLTLWRDGVGTRMKEALRKFFGKKDREGKQALEDGNG